MLITDFRKGNALGVGACLAPASASAYRKIRHARCIVYQSERVPVRAKKKRRKDRPRLYTNRVVSTACSRQEAVESSRCCTPT